MRRKKGKGKWIALAILLLIIAWIVFRVITKPTYPYIDSPRPYLGNAEASIILSEYADLQCPACAAAHPLVKQIVEEHKDNIKYEFKHFPLTAIHGFAFDAGRAAECANDQDKFWEFVDDSFNNQNKLSKKGLKTRASSLGLDRERFDACLDSGAKAEFVREDMSDGNTLRVSGTPSFFLNGKEIPYAQLQQLGRLIDAEVAK
jgi:protein-disulfide isomerase